METPAWLLQWACACGFVLGLTLQFMLVSGGLAPTMSWVVELLITTALTGGLLVYLLRSTKTVA